MAKDWIIDVLEDVRDFAAANGMPVLAEELEESISVAAAEIGQAPASQAGRYSAQIGGHAGPAFARR